MSQDVEHDFGKVLRELRKLASLSLLALAKQSGVPYATLHALEAGTSPPSILNLKRLVDALGGDSARQKMFEALGLLPVSEGAKPLRRVQRRVFIRAAFHASMAAGLLIVTRPFQSLERSSTRALVTSSTVIEDQIHAESYARRAIELDEASTSFSRTAVQMMLPRYAFLRSDDARRVVGMLKLVLGMTYEEQRDPKFGGGPPLLGRKHLESAEMEARNSGDLSLAYIAALHRVKQLNKVGERSQPWLFDESRAICESIAVESSSTTLRALAFIQLAKTELADADLDAADWALDEAQRQLGQVDSHLPLWPSFLRDHVHILYRDARLKLLSRYGDTYDEMRMVHKDLHSFRSGLPTIIADVTMPYQMYRSRLFSDDPGRRDRAVRRLLITQRTAALSGFTTQVQRGSDILLEAHTYQGLPILQLRCGHSSCRSDVAQFSTECMTYRCAQGHALLRMDE